MIQRTSVPKTDVLKEKARQIKGLLENCIAMLSISPVFTKTSTQIGYAWGQAHALATNDDFSDKQIMSYWKGIAKDIDKAIQELAKTEQTAFKPVYEDAEALLCDAWENCLASAPSPDESPQFSAQGYMSVKWELASYKYLNETESPALPAFDPFLIDADNRNKGESHRSADIARQALADRLWDGKTRLYICGDVSVFHHKYLGLAKEKPTAFKLIHHRIAFTFIFHDQKDIPNDAMETARFESWAIENEESAIFGDGQ